MLRLDIAFVVSGLVWAFACGNVTSSTGGDGGAPDAAECEPGAFLRCDGDDLIRCSGDGVSEEVEACSVACNAEEQHCNECVPETSVCQEGEERLCGAEGLELEPRACPLGCDGDGVRCLDVDPSNGLAAFLDDADTGPDLELSEETFIDTSDGTVVVGGSTVEVPNALIDAPEGGVEVRVFMVRSLTITSDVTAERPSSLGNAPALAFVSHGDVLIEGALRVSAQGTENGPGYLNDSIGGGGFVEDGRGGGGFGGSGGRGGARFTQPFDGREGGGVVGNPELVPLRGGSRGGGASQGGGAGGAIQLVSRTRISVSAGGSIEAGGGHPDPERQYGGGSGGAILLEAPEIVVAGESSALVANGGGGGCRFPAVPPENGRLDDQRAAGCQALGDSGDGGGGGVRGSLLGDGQDGANATSDDGNGGGGGGGVGRIRINIQGDGFSQLGGAIVSPSPSEGELGVR